MISLNQAEDSLETILNQPEYQVYYRDNRNFIQIWWDKFKTWIGDLLSDWFSSLEPTSNVGDAIIILLLIAGIVFVCFVLFLSSRNWMRKRSLRNDQPLYQLKEQDWSSFDHFKEANRLEQQQSYSMATRHLFLTFLLTLHEKEWLEARMWKTNWEYYDELKVVRINLADDFYQLALFFEEVTYGAHKIEGKAYLTYRKRIEKWLEQLQPSHSSIEREEGEDTCHN